MTRVARSFAPPNGLLLAVPLCQNDQPSRQRRQRFRSIRFRPRWGWEWFFGPLCLLAAAGCFAWGVDALSWVRATGYVIEVDGDQVVRFADVEETVRDIPPDDDVSVGDVVSVWYPVDHPRDATLMSSWESFGIGVFVGGALGALGLGMVIGRLFDLSLMFSAAERSDPARPFPAPSSPPDGNTPDRPASGGEEHEARAASHPGAEAGR